MKGTKAPRHQIDAMLDTLDALDAQQIEVNVDHRHADRISYRTRNTILYRASSEEPIVVVTRNISKHGMAFLYSQYLQMGEDIRIAVVDKERGDWNLKEARINRCEHVSGMIHEVGIEFKEPLPDSFLAKPNYCPTCGQVVEQLKAPPPQQPTPTPQTCEADETSTG